MKKTILALTTLFSLLMLPAVATAQHYRNGWPHHVVPNTPSGYPYGLNTYRNGRNWNGGYYSNPGQFPNQGYGYNYNSYGAYGNFGNYGNYGYNPYYYGSPYFPW